MKNYDGKEEPSFLVYLDANNLYGSAMYEKLPVRGFKWVRNVSRIDEDFIKNYYKNGDIEFILDVDILKNYMIYITIYHFYRKE